MCPCSLWQRRTPWSSAPSPPTWPAAVGEERGCSRVGISGCQAGRRCELEVSREGGNVLSGDMIVCPASCLRPRRA